jgi:hypothetical protein
METVQVNLTQVQSDALAENMPALAGDGTQLAADAGTALADPPPVKAMSKPYQAAMSNLIQAGNLLGEGNVMVVPVATRYIQAATPEIITTTNVLQATGCSNI